MITQIQLQNFKSLANINLSVCPLNLLTGLNSSGKSSLIQSLLLLLQSPDIGGGKLLLRGAAHPLFNAGIAEDVYYKQGNGAIKFSYGFDNGTALTWNFAYRAGQSNRNDYLQASETYTNNQLGVLLNAPFQYLQAERLAPKDFYPASNDNVLNKKTLGILGEHTAYYLNQYGNTSIESDAVQHPRATSRRLIHQAAAWLSEISPNVALSTRLTENNENVELRYKYGTEFYKPKNVGFGLSYALPVIVALLTAERGKLIIIENPESHVHPRGQAELGRLLAAAAQSGAQLFIETHSDHILNGIRVAVKQGLTTPNKVGIFFHQQTGGPTNTQYTQITPISIDTQGQLNNEPPNFLDEWNNQLFKLL